MLRSNRPSFAEITGDASGLVMRVASVMACAAACALPSSGAHATPFEPTVETIASPDPGTVNTHLVIVRGGVVIVDAQRVSSQAARVVLRVGETGLPVLAILLTQARPDHFGGLAELHRAFPAAPIVASVATARTISTDPFGYIDRAASVLGADFGATVPAPDRTVRHHETIVFGGEAFRFDELGPGEADDMTAVVMPWRHLLFPGELVGNRVTPVIVEGRTTAWQGQIARAQEAYSDTERIYPGHGPSMGGSELLSIQARYLRDLREAVRSHAIQGRLTQAGVLSLIAIMNTIYPGYSPAVPADGLLKRNVEAVANELRVNHEMTR